MTTSNETGVQAVPPAQPQQPVQGDPAVPSLDVSEPLQPKSGSLTLQQAAHQRAETLRAALVDIAESKSLTATPTQFYQHLQRVARSALTDDAMAEPATSDATDL